MDHQAASRLAKIWFVKGSGVAKKLQNTVIGPKAMTFVTYSHAICHCQHEFNYDKIDSMIN